MALLFFDGFETYASTATMTSGLEDVYDLHDGVGTSEVSIVPSSRITGGQAMQVSTSNSFDSGGNPAQGPQIPLSGLGSTDTWIFGVAVKVSGLGVAGSVRPIFELLDSEGVPTVALRLNVDGDLTVDRVNSFSTVITLDTAAAVITDTAWHYLEWKVKINNVTGTWNVHLDEVEIMDGSGNTDQQNAQRAVHLRFGHISTKTITYDDLYILDTTGTINNDYLGDVLVQRLRPDGPVTSQFTLFGGATNWESVNELGEDDDTTYVESNAVAQRDLYTYEDLPTATSGIFGVVAKPVLRKSDIGSRTYKLFCSSSAFEDETATLYPANSYVRQAKIFETDPATGDLWTDGGVNRAQFGVEIVS